MSHCRDLSALILLCTLHRTEKRDTRREVKALKAANVENAIEQELLNRLKQGTYGDIYNFDQKVYERVLEAAEVPAVMKSPPELHMLYIVMLLRHAPAVLSQQCVWLAV